MASGTEQFGFITTPVLINLNSKGVGVKCVSTVDGNEPTNPANDSTVLVAAKGSGITSMKDLAGKNVAEVQLTSLNSLSVMVLAKQAGIDPHSIHQIAIPFPQMPAALSQGRVQAAVIVAPFTQTALGEGATVAHPPEPGPVPERHAHLPRRHGLLHLAPTRRSSASSARRWTSRSRTRRRTSRW